MSTVNLCSWVRDSIAHRIVGDEVDEEHLMHGRPI